MLSNFCLQIDFAFKYSLSICHLLIRLKRRISSSFLAVSPFPRLRTREDVAARAGLGGPDGHSSGVPGPVPACLAPANSGTQPVWLVQAGGTQARAPRCSQPDGLQHRRRVRQKRRKELFGFMGRRWYAWRNAWDATGDGEAVLGPRDCRSHERPQGHEGESPTIFLPISNQALKAKAREFASPTDGGAKPAGDGGDADGWTGGDGQVRE